MNTPTTPTVLNIPTDFDDVPTDNTFLIELSPYRNREWWRLVAESKPVPPPQLSAREIGVLDPVERMRYDAERLQFFKSITLDTNQMQLARHMVKHLLSLGSPPPGRSRGGVIIDGPSSGGKTTLTLSITAAFERRLRLDRQRQGLAPYFRTAAGALWTPTVNLCIPANATTRSLAAAIVEAFEVEIGSRATENSLTQQAIKLLVESGTRLITIDEAHNLKMTTKANLLAMNQLKAFQNRVPAVFVLAGVELGAEGCILDNSSAARADAAQLRSRFSVVTIRPVDISTDAGRAEMGAVLANFASGMRLAEDPAPLLQRNITHLWKRSFGLLGPLRRLLEGAYALALESPNQVLTKAHLTAVNDVVQFEGL